MARAVRGAPSMPRVLGLALVLLAGACSLGSATATAEAEVGSAPPRAWAPAKTTTGNLRVASFNIRNFPDGVLPPKADAGADAVDLDARSGLVRTQRETDVGLLLDVLERLDFDVLAVQEINDPARLRDVLGELGRRTGRTYEAVFDDGWGHPQHVGIVVRTDRVRVSDVVVHPEVARKPTMRAGLSARITSTRPGGADFGLFVVHLASGDSGGRATFRAEQATSAAQAIAARQAELGDRDFVVVGDFNTARGDAELAGFDAAMASSGTGLARIAPDLACTTYHVKSPSQPLLQPGAIDHVYLAGMSERDPLVPVSVGTHCFERACAPFESDSAAHGTTYWGVSDHCPVMFELKDEDDDR